MRPVVYRWQWDLASSPEELWPLVADTDRFNQDSALPPVERAGPAPPGAPPHRQILRLHMAGMTVTWEEEPFEWIRPRRFGVCRRYLGGPVEEIRVRTELHPRDPAGTRLVYEVEALPRSPAGRLAVAVQIGWRARQRFGRAFLEYDAAIQSRRPPRVRPIRPTWAPGGRRRLAEGAAVLMRAPVPGEIVERLVRWIGEADDRDASAMRPYALADEWHFPRRDVLAVFLHAVRAGLLEFRWNLLCPMCRGAKQSAAALAALETEVHCDACLIRADAEFDRCVELTFRPAPAIRTVSDDTYCVGSPQRTPHIVAQQILGPGESREIAAAFEPGAYRARVLHAQAHAPCEVPGGGPWRAAFRITDGGVVPEPAAEVPPHSIRITNVTASERVWIFERTQWRDDAVTAADVFAFHVFRDLFAREALRPRTQMALRAATILFTDLCGSTRMYRDAGDAVAFGTVLDHFDVLREEVARAGGAVVKNMGDAIMAVFPRPAGAVEAAIAAMRRLAAAGLVLKAGAHHGPCIAVTWDDRLDYFGTTVNLAARAQQLSRGGDIVVAAPTHADPELRRWLEQNAPVVRCEGFSAQVRGFEPERLEFHRITPVVRTRSGPDLEKAFRCDLRLRARERHAGIGRGHRTCAALRAGDYGADGNNRA